MQIIRAKFTHPEVVQIYLEGGYVVGVAKSDVDYIEGSRVGLEGHRVLIHIGEKRWFPDPWGATFVMGVLDPYGNGHTYIHWNR